MLAGVAWWRGERDAPPWCSARSAALFALGGLVVPTRLGPVERAWMGLAHAISKVTTPIVMGVVYFLVITPVGDLRRDGGRQPACAPTRAPPAGWTAQQTPRGDLTRQF